MRRLTTKRYRWLRRVGALLGAAGGFVVDLLVLAAEDARLARAGTRRVDYFPAEVPIFLALGALVGWLAVILIARSADLTPLKAERIKGGTSKHDD